MNIGHSSRQKYDKCYLPDMVEESTSPLFYRVNCNQIYNKNRCLTTLGPRSATSGDSTAVKVGYAPKQDLVDLDSIMTNRNVRENRCKRGHVNPIDVTKFKSYDFPICDNFLNPENSRLSYPAADYRDISVNRFYNLNNDPQAPIFWNFAINSRLEEIDNFIPEMPIPWPDLTGPIEDRTKPRPCVVNCGPRCPNR